ncbi:hypothetical protein ABU614_00775 [Lysobacter firmicutimachus]|uniref:DUF3365 domain-containing protein n=1 Tax=Lysobacter firmicutimachus TaxID=1792846 RepID=A0AAU8MSW2_9GAMM
MKIMHDANNTPKRGRGMRSVVLSALKRCLAAGLLIASTQAGAVKVNPMTTKETPVEKQMFGALERVSRDAAKELAALRQSASGASLEGATFSDYVTRLSGGTVSTWRMKQVLPDGSTKVIAKWDARNGRSVPRQVALKQDGVEQFSHYGSGRPQLRPIVGSEKQRYSDAEVKALERAVQVRQAKGLRPSEVILEGVIDKPPCANCMVNLRDAELLAGTEGYDALNAVSSTKAAGQIEVFHFDGPAKGEFANARRAAVGSGLEAAGCN